MAIEGAVIVEANTQNYFNELWVVTLKNKEEAVKRVIERSKGQISEEEVRNRLKS